MFEIWGGGAIFFFTREPGNATPRLGDQRFALTLPSRRNRIGEALFGDDTAVDVSYTIGARSLREGLPPLGLITTEDFLRFIIATSQGIINNGQKKVTVGSINTFTEWFFTGFTGVTGNRIDKEDRHAVYDISACRSRR